MRKRRQSIPAPRRTSAPHGMTPTILAYADNVTVLVSAPWDEWYDQWMAILNMRKEPHMRQKQWNDLSDTQKGGIVLVGVLQLMLLAAALLNIRRRPVDMINGSKRLWTMVEVHQLYRPTSGPPHEI